MGNNNAWGQPHNLTSPFPSPTLPDLASVASAHGHRQMRQEPSCCPDVQA